MAGDSVCPDDVINVLVATDIHLGYAEKDEFRGEDSFNTFEEILQIAQQSNVDFVLLGGDLFHDSKPSPACFFKCISILRRYCLGEKEVKMEFLSDQALNFSHCQNPTVNYEDPNLNISIPVFTIHGNHDDATGLAQLSSLDILASMGLVNYFGKITNLQEIEIYPILLQKGVTKVALYGLSHIKDNRLCRLFKDDKVSLMRPSEGDDWFSILALHQNRADRGLQNFIPESVLPDFLNFVLWGHEHDCRIDTEVSAANEVNISQPGSTVATSLSQEEAGKKYVGLLSINRANFKFQKIQLRTVRPFIFQNSTLEDFEFDKDSKKTLSTQVEEYIKEEIDRLIIKSKELLTGHPKQPTLPLVRIRVEYQNQEEQFNAIRAGQSYRDKVANPTDLIILRRSIKEAGIKKEDDLDQEQMEKTLQTRVESKVIEYFRDVSDKRKLQVLSAKGMCQALMAYIDKNDAEAIELLMNHQIEKTLSKLKESDVVLANIDNEISEVVKARLEKQEEEEEEANKILNDPDRVKTTVPNDDAAIEMEESDEDVPLKPIRGRGSRGGRGTRGARTPRATRGKATNNNSNSTVIQDDSPEETEPIISPTTRSGRRGRGNVKATPPSKQSEITSHYSSSQNRRAATVGKNYVIDVLSDSD